MERKNLSTAAVVVLLLVILTAGTVPPRTKL
jgi:hypothetical protein